MKTGTCVVEVMRGDVVESQHRVHVAVCHADQGLIASTGNPAHISFVRSAIKMFQALPLVESGGVERFGFTTEEVALCTASHGGEPFHVAAARSMLAKIDLTEDALACGPHPPMHAPSAEAMHDAGLPSSRIHNNCSGKHSGLLAFTLAHRSLGGGGTQQQWATQGYHEAAHPTQQRILSTLSKWMGINEDDIELAVDGCGLPTYAMPLDAVAEGCAKFSAAAADGQEAPAKIFSAMTRHPEFVAGTDRLDTDVMRAARGRLFVKVGAEGFYCAAVPSMRLGIALKVEDGATRASEPALLAVLKAVDAIGNDELALLTRYAEPTILNTRRESVGSIRSAVTLRGD